jgi:hypothetical protein
MKRIDAELADEEVEVGDLAATTSPRTRKRGCDAVPRVGSTPGHVRMGTSVRTVD